MANNRRSLPKSVVDEFSRLKEGNQPNLALKIIHGNYYVYKERGIWIKSKRSSKTISEYLGRITEDGHFIKKSFHAKNDLESAKALIAEHGGEVTWHKDSEEQRQDGSAQSINADKVDLSILTSLSMNSRMPVSKIAKLAGINEQTAYSRIKVLEKNLGMHYLLEVNVEVLGFTTYLIFVKFEEGMPPLEEMENAFKGEPKVQFAAITKGDYDIVAYMLDENSFKAEDDLWKIMSKTPLSKYNAKWHMIPFGQTYSFVPLRQEFVEHILAQRQWHRRGFVMITPEREDILKREYLLLKELNKNAACDFSEIDKKYELGRGASRYTYQQLIEEQIITRPTATFSNLSLKYIGILRIETVNPEKVSRERHKLLHEEIAYGPITNKYALIGNTSMPESLTLFIPIMEKDEIEDESAHLRSIDGTITRSMIISKVLVGSLCYRRFDNAHTVMHQSLTNQKRIEPKEVTEYE